MNLKRFTARTSRDALALVRQAFGDDAVVMSTKPCAEGVEVLALAPESVAQLERLGQAAQQISMPRPAPLQAQVQPQAHRPPMDATEASPAPLRERGVSFARRAERIDPEFGDSLQSDPQPLAHSAVQEDVQRLQMSTLSFQDYVRDRMLRRRDAERRAEADKARQSTRASKPADAGDTESLALETQPIPSRAVSRPAAAAAAARRPAPVLHDEIEAPVAEAPDADAVAPKRSTAVPAARAAVPAPASITKAIAAPPAASHAEQVEMMSELRSMRGLIEQRFGALAFMEKLQRQPRQAQLAQRLLEAGFSPVLIRKMVQSLPDDLDEVTWAASVLERNLSTAEREPALEDVGGVYALIGATGVGKTTSTAKLAAAFATHHGAANLGLITLDAYRVGAHEQLRTYGRILGVPVHTAHDRASLEDLLELLSGKRMVLIDTAGMAQRDSRTRELLEMLSHRSINRVLVVNASAQGETIEDQLGAYAAASCNGIILSKLDEAVKLAPALDAMIRHKLKVLAVANGQRVPEDWHRLSANALVQRSLRGSGNAAWKFDDADVNLIFAALPAAVHTSPVRQPVADITRGVVAHA
ncbi:MAG: flagellar biosynthesis protein FlhF [Pseudomonadota bacterium]|nr:flagellar biosynthesis protein FlhF [Pseudomonadota bacterium]